MFSWSIDAKIVETSRPSKVGLAEIFWLGDTRRSLAVVFLFGYVLHVYIYTSLAGVLEVATSYYAR
jgi:hypothetical protein